MTFISGAYRSSLVWGLYHKNDGTKGIKRYHTNLITLLMLNIQAVRLHII